MAPKPLSEPLGSEDETSTKQLASSMKLNPPLDLLLKAPGNPVPSVHSDESEPMNHDLTMTGTPRLQDDPPTSLGPSTLKRPGSDSPVQILEEKKHCARSLKSSSSNIQQPRDPPDSPDSDLEDDNFPPLSRVNARTDTDYDFTAQIDADILNQPQTNPQGIKCGGDDNDDDDDTSSSCILYIPDHNSDNQAPKDKGKLPHDTYPDSEVIPPSPPSPPHADLGLPTFPPPKPRPAHKELPTRSIASRPMTLAPTPQRLVIPAWTRLVEDIRPDTPPDSVDEEEEEKPSDTSSREPLRFDSPPPDTPDTLDTPMSESCLEFPSTSSGVPTIRIHPPTEEPKKGAYPKAASPPQPQLLKIPGYNPFRVSTSKRKREVSLAQMASATKKRRDTIFGPSSLLDPASFGPPKAHEDMAFLFLNLRHGMKVLNLGCREGDVTIQIRDDIGENGSVVGMDYSSKNIVAARAKRDGMGIHNILFRQLEDGTELPFNDNTFDYVYASDLMNRIPVHRERSNIKAILREMVRVVKPGGYIATRDMTAQYFYPDFGLGSLLTRNMLLAAGLKEGFAGGSMPYLFKCVGFDLQDETLHISASTSC
ncbi:hypothetical protein F5Y16DRAFT_358177 [Xylariaceae sp. FL0255]|nr:hypothetical protein F5Y16DRAFT_358177 [Xylariaceae sp. FL0255]